VLQRVVFIIVVLHLCSLVIQSPLFRLKKRRAVSDDSKLASSPHADDDALDSQSERSDTAVKCTTVNKHLNSRQVTVYAHIKMESVRGTAVMCRIHNIFTSLNRVAVVVLLPKLDEKFMNIISSYRLIASASEDHL